MASTILTDAAEALLSSAVGEAPPVVITHVAIGDGGGVAYEPSFTRTTLKRELARLPIDSRTKLTNNSWRVKVKFPPTGTQIDVREIGFFDANNVLIALWGGADVVARQAGIIDYTVVHVLDFSRVAENLIIVDGPNDEYDEFIMAQTANNFLLMEEQLRQGMALAALSK